MRFLSLFMVLSICGCVPVQYQLGPTTEGQPVAVAPVLYQRITELGDSLSGLGAETDPVEARLIAETAIHYSLQQADDYRLTRPPLVHNVLVNAGLRPRGLCIHWTEDLLKKLHALDMQTFELWWGVATRRTQFHVEHSTVVVTSRGQPFETGLVLDGWRDSGWLYWVPVTADKYEWNVMGNYISGTGLTAEMSD